MVINIITVTPEIGQEQHDKWIRWHKKCQRSVLNKTERALQRKRKSVGINVWRSAGCNRVQLPLLVVMLHGRCQVLFSLSGSGGGAEWWRGRERPLQSQRNSSKWPPGLHTVLAGKWRLQSYSVRPHWRTATLRATCTTSARSTCSQWRMLTFSASDVDHLSANLHETQSTAEVCIYFCWNLIRRILNIVNAWLMFSITRPNITFHAKYRDE